MSYLYLVLRNLPYIFLFIFTFNLSFATLNVNGMHDTRKCSNIIQWGKIFDFDIMLLQETFLSTPTDYKFFKDNWGGQLFFSPSLSNHSGGVCIAFKSKLPFHISEVKRDRLGRCISVLCAIYNTTFRICNIHAPCSPTDRKHFLRELFAFTPGNHPIILGGDFNCVTDNFDSSNTSASASIFEGSKEIKDFTSTNNLIDSYRVHNPKSPGHTWSRISMNQSSRIDRIYLPKDFIITNVTTSPFPYSDHNPVHATVQIPNNRKHGKGYWKYNVSLNNNKEFCNELRFYYSLWSTLKKGFDSITDWWENIKVKIRQLAVRHGARVAIEKRKKLAEFQSSCSSSNIEEMDNIIRAESRGALIRARVKVLEEGEKPTAFFFRQEKRRAGQKEIKSIRNRFGNVVENDDEIMEVFHMFYSDLYSESSGSDTSIQNEFIDCLNNPLDEDARNSLDQPITLNDVKSALAVVATNKSPGIDGLPYDFYSNFFDMLGNDIVDVYNDIFNSGIMSKTQRTSIVTLLKKKGDQSDPTNWRPISLLNADYKIIAKILQMKLSKFMPDIVNEYQTCSVPGRSIHNNMLLIRDIIDYSVIKKSPCTIISIDQYKAFDTVNWSFLFKVLKKLNFGDQFCKWISILYNNILSRIIINGNISDPISLSRGVRQGCPVSPLLYVLFIEPIARFIQNSTNIRGFTMPGSSANPVKFLQYADDATCVATTPTDITEFLNVFSQFQKATGASVNLHKTHGLIIGKDLPSRHKSASIQWSTTAIEITGIVFGTKDAVNTNWTKKVTKAVSLINSWRNRYLTLLGKVLVVNTVIYPLFYFIAPIYCIPDYVIKEVNKVAFSLVWGENKPDLVSRKVITMDKRQGGLKLDSFKYKMDALFVKPLIPVFTTNMPSHLTITRFFIAKQIRKILPQIWSNSRPNSCICSPPLLYACRVITNLHNVDQNFVQSCTCTKDIVRLLHSSDTTVTVVRKNPSMPWDIIWRKVFDNILDNKLISFQWRLVHHILFTGERVKDWGIGDGICPFTQCKIIKSIETTDHIFWTCPKIQEILTWVVKIFKYLTSDNVDFDINLFLYGFPTDNIAKAAFHRIWVIFCTTKFAIWKSRCLHVFEKQVQKTSVLVSIIKHDIKLRVETDYNRFHVDKFKKVWTEGNSFVTIEREKLIFNL